MSSYHRSGSAHDVLRGGGGAKPDEHLKQQLGFDGSDDDASIATDDEVELPDADGPASPHPDSSRRATAGPSSATRVVDAAVAAHRAQPAMGATSYARTLGGSDFGGSPSTASRSFSGGGVGAYGVLSRQHSAMMMGVGSLSLHSGGSVGESEDLLGVVAAQRATIERLTADKAQLSADLETANFRVTTSHSGNAAHSKLSAKILQRQQDMVDDAIGQVGPLLEALAKATSAAGASADGGDDTPASVAAAIKQKLEAMAVKIKQSAESGKRIAARQTDTGSSAGAAAAGGAAGGAAGTKSRSDDAALVASAVAALASPKGSVRNLFGALDGADASGLEGTSSSDASAIIFELEAKVAMLTAQVATHQELLRRMRAELSRATDVKAAAAAFVVTALESARTAAASGAATSLHGHRLVAAGDGSALHILAPGISVLQDALRRYEEGNDVAGGSALGALATDATAAAATAAASAAAAAAASKTDAEAEALRSDLQKTRALLDTAKKSLVEMTARATGHSKAMDEALAQRQALQEELAAARADAAAARRELAAGGGSTSSAVAPVAAVASAASAVELQAARDEIAALRAQLQAAQATGSSASASASQAAAALESQLAEARASLATARADAVASGGEAERLRGALKRAEDNLAAAVSASASSTGKLEATLRASLADAEARCAEAEKAVARLQGETEALRGQLAAQTESARSTGDQLRAAKEQLASSSSQGTEMSALVTQLRDAVAQKEAALATKVASLAGQEEEGRRLASTIATQERAMADAQGALEVARASQAAAKEEVASLKSRLAAAQEGLAAEVARATAAGEAAVAAAKQAAATQLRAVQKQLDVKVAALAALSRQLGALATVARDLRGEQARLRSDAAAAAADTAAVMATAKRHMAAQIAAHLASVADLTERYRKEVTERRRLHNLVMELRGNIRVFARVRPPLAFELADASTGGVCVSYPGQGELAVVNAKRAMKAWEFDQVFQPGTGNEEVFSHTQPLIVSALDGFNVCIFAYGQTGSGKTFTMEGNESSRGINYRSLETLFALRDERAADVKYDIAVAMVEIYNETLLDMLSASGSSKLTIRESPAQGVFVPDLTIKIVENLSDVLKLMAQGYKTRATYATNMNEHSSRSHCMLSVFIRGAHKHTGQVMAGKLHLVDLAGSERVSKSGVTGDRLKEAQNINKSLSALGDVIQARMEKRGHVPYRNSTLTFLLSDSLAGDSKVLMFVNLSPVLSNVEETTCSLNFASRARNVEMGKATRHVTGGSGVSSGSAGASSPATAASPGGAAATGAAGGPRASIGGVARGGVAGMAGARRSIVGVAAVGGAGDGPSSVTPRSGGDDSSEFVGGDGGEEDWGVDGSASEFGGAAGDETASDLDASIAAHGAAGSVDTSPVDSTPSSAVASPALVAAAPAAVAGARPVARAGAPGSTPVARASIALSARSAVMARSTAAAAAPGAAGGGGGMSPGTRPPTGAASNARKMLATGAAGDSKPVGRPSLGGR